MHFIAQGSTRPKHLAFLLTDLLHGADPSWEANRFSVSQEIPHILWNPKGSLPHLQVPTTCLYPEPARSSPYPHIPLADDPSYM